MIRIFWSRTPRECTSIQFSEENPGEPPHYIKVNPNLFQSLNPNRFCLSPAVAVGGLWELWGLKEMMKMIVIVQQALSVISESPTLIYQSFSVRSSKFLLVELIGMLMCTLSHHSGVALVAGVSVQSSGMHGLPSLFTAHIKPSKMQIHNDALLLESRSMMNVGICGHVVWYYGTVLCGNFPT